VGEYESAGLSGLPSGMGPNQWIMTVDILRTVQKVKDGFKRFEVEIGEAGSFDDPSENVSA